MVDPSHGEGDMAGHQLSEGTVRRGCPRACSSSVKTRTGGGTRPAGRKSDGQISSCLLPVDAAANGEPGASSGALDRFQLATFDIPDTEV